MSKMVCDYCGHENPHGTILCESCGKPLQDEQTKKILTMRYEGSARRSQTYQRTMIDKIWNMFSSVKVGVTLIVLVFIAAAIGTIFPQADFIPPNLDPATYYQDQYGVLGRLYYQLGFDNLYGSWWFIVLISLLGLSIIVASVDRGIPLRRALKNQRTTRHDVFLKRQRVYGATKTEDPDEQMTNAKQSLKNQHYKVKEEEGNLFGEKGRFSRWGAYVNHTGLIILMIAAILRFIPGMYVDDDFWVREGATEKIPGTHGEYYLKNHKFIYEQYKKKNKRFSEAIDREAKDGPLPKNYQTNVSLYKRSGDQPLGAKPDLKKVRDDKIKVNHPLKMDGYGVYQVDFQLNEFTKMAFQLKNKSSKKGHGTFTVDLLHDQKKVYNLGDGYKVKLLAYFPDFYFNDKDEPATKTPYPNNPAFIFKTITPDKPKGETSFVGIKQNTDIKGHNDYKLTFKGLDTKNLSALTVHKDSTIWVFIIGGMIFMIGVIQGLYWQHRRIWLKQKDGEIWLAAVTNKNWFGLKKDITKLTEASGLNEPEDKLEDKKSEDKHQ